MLVFRRGFSLWAVMWLTTTPAYSQGVPLVLRSRTTMDSLEVDVLRWLARSKTGRLYLSRVESPRTDVRSAPLDVIGRAAGFTVRSMAACQSPCPEWFAILTPDDIQVMVGPLLAPTDSTRGVSYEIVVRQPNGSLWSRALGLGFVARGGQWVLKEDYMTSH